MRYNQKSAGIWYYILFGVLLATINMGCQASQSAERLLGDLLEDYRNTVGPFKKHQPLMVSIELKISQLVEIDETKELMITSVWLKQEWKDNRLKWEPANYDNLTSLTLPILLIWKPDINLLNVAGDDGFDMLVENNGKIFHDGTVLWSPPGIFTSICQIDSEYFPFDTQECSLKIGSWAYTSQYLDLEPMNKKIDLSDYEENGEWNILDLFITKRITQYACSHCANKTLDKSNITYKLVVKRNPLFYLVTLFLPCVLVSFSTCLVFYLPSNEQERVTLSITVLMAVIFFLILIPGFVPSTSNAVPLLGKFATFTLITSSFAVVCAVFNVRIYHSKAKVCKIPNWARSILIVHLPRYLGMKRPDSDDDLENYRQRKKTKKLHQQIRGTIRTPYVPNEKAYYNKRFGKSAAKQMIKNLSSSLLEEVRHREGHTFGIQTEKPNLTTSYRIPPEHMQISQNVSFITEHLKNKDILDQITSDWQFIALVLDRLLLYVLFTVCCLGSLGMILSAPGIWSDSTPRFNPPNITRPTILEVTYY